MTAPFVVGDSSPFLKRVLIPFWVIRIIIMLIEIVLYAFVIAVILTYTGQFNRLKHDYSTNYTVNTLLAITGVIITIIVICLIFDIVCIVKRSRRTLSPPFFLGVNIGQTTIWLVMFILSMLSKPSGIVIGISVIILLSFVGLLIYAGVVYHQYRKGALRGTFQPANNSEAHKLVLQNTDYTPNYAVPQPLQQTGVHPDYHPDYQQHQPYPPAAAYPQQSGQMPYDPNTSYTNRPGQL